MSNVANQRREMRPIPKRNSQECFGYIEAVKAPNGIADDDIYNYDETGYAMAKALSLGTANGQQFIQAIGAEGGATAAIYLALAGQYHLASWYTSTQATKQTGVVVRFQRQRPGRTTNEARLYSGLEHFNEFTARRCKSDYRLLVLDGHESHHSAAFELYCQEHKIITVCMPPHSSHLLQPLDIGCFGPLKQAYSREVEALMRAHINHISRLEFLSGFHKAHTAALTPKNIRSSFAGAGIVPYDPDRVLSKLDVQLPVATPVNSRPGTANAVATWTTKTPLNPSEN
ncbi:hypothetical protein Dda_4391 [Drechslerella dactyloides]|uniref:DDE-1 domain-containing protein n=1 Tax=Drechslerella dactyloides TaxID=74499 RepID=A0AAD6NKJ5_DREDA|nr:hypothetical protein Dda_4391 [Drechslerella dactyloides]